VPGVVRVQDSVLAGLSVPEGVELEHEGANVEPVGVVLPARLRGSEDEGSYVFGGFYASFCCGG